MGIAGPEGSTTDGTASFALAFSRVGDIAPNFPQK